MLHKLLENILSKLQTNRTYCKFRDKMHDKRTNVGAAIAKHIDEHHGKSKWADIAQPLTSILSLSIYLSVGIVYADYKGELLIYILTSISIGIIFLLLIREVLCCIGSTAIGNIYEKISSNKKRITIGVILILCALYCYSNYSPVEYYSSISEIYGIPRGVESTALSKTDLKSHAEYWKIKENKFTNHITLTYVDAYKQTDIMHHYSTLYNMSLFQNPARIEIDYKKSHDKGKYRAKGPDAFNAAGENKFREPTKICYYNNSGKLILKMQYKEGLYKVLSYSSQDAPQLVNSLLLQAPDRQTQENDMYQPQIEVTYNSTGLPETRQIISGINSYGVCGESYTYNTNNQISTLYFLDSYGMPVCNINGIMTVDFQYDDSGNLQSICYYSDADKTEKTNGFSGVFCEKFHYENGNLTERLQLGQNGGSSYDTNTVCKYCYVYEKGRLIEESYYGRNNSPVYIKLDNLLFNRVKYDKHFFKRQILISFDLKPPQNSSETSDDISMSSYPAGSNLSLNGTTADDHTSRKDTAKSNAGNEASETGIDNNRPLPKNRPAESDTELNTNTLPDANNTDVNFQEANISYSDTPTTKEENTDFLPSTYAGVRFTIRKGAIKKMEYLNRENSLTVNEHGYAAREFKYNRKKRLIKESYLNNYGQKCLIDDGYAAIETAYTNNSSEQIEFIKYLDIKGDPIDNKTTGYAIIKYEYDPEPIETIPADNPSQSTISRQKQKPYSEQTRIIRESYIDQDNNPVLSRDLGYAIVEKTYNENGLLVKEVYADTKGNLTYRSDYGVAKILYEYSDIGNLVCEQYFDLDPNDSLLNRIDTGYAIIYSEYEMGHKVKEYYQGMQDGMLCAVTDKNTGVAAKTFGYSNGQIMEVAYYDVNQKPVLCSDMGYAKMKYEYRDGKISKLSYYGTSDQLILRKDLGAAVIRYEYDDAGRETFIRYYGTDEKPVISTEYCCAGFHYNYNDMQADKSDIFYIGLNGNPMIRKDLGFAHVYYEYDDDGNISYSSYWDAEEKPALYKDRGYASYTYKYDKETDCAEYKYFDADGHPVVRRDYGYSCCKERYENGKCIERRYYKPGETENSDDVLVLRKDKGYAIVKFDYDEFGRCISEKYYGTNDADDTENTEGTEDTEGSENKLIISTEYQCAGFLYDYDEAGHEKSIGYIGTDGKPFIRGDRGFAFVKYEYNDRGLRISSRYYDVDGETPVISTMYHCAGYDYQYDDRGNESESYYIDPDGKPMFRRDYGNVFDIKKYDNVGNLIGEAYYDDQNNPAVWRERGYASFEYTLENGNIREIRYYDTNHKLTIRKDTGCAVERREYDDAGRCISKLYYDTNGQLILCGDNNCAGFRYAYDEMGNHTDTWYLGIDGNTMFCRELGYAHVQYEYDEQGRQTRKSFYDVSDKPAFHIDEGYASSESDYDAAGNCLETRYYDVYGHLTNRLDTGCAVKRYEYDSLGRCILEQYFDSWGDQPVINKKYRCAGFKYVYDDRGRKTDIFYLDTAGEYMIRNDIGISHIHSKYDDFGNLSGEDYSIMRYTGDEDEPYEDIPAVWKDKGYSSFTNVYEGGQCIRTCYEHEGSYVLRKDKKYAKIEWDYDEYGQCKSVRYKGTSGQLVISDQSCAGFDYDYNEKGEQTDTWYIGLNGKPMIRDDKEFAHIRSTYDEMGNEITVEYLDADEKPSACSDGGYTSYKKSYLNGKCITMRYYEDYSEDDKDSQLTRRNDRDYAYSIDVYERGNWIESRYYDENDNLVNRSDEGYAVCRSTYDASGNEILCLYYDATGEKTVINSNYNLAGWKFAYDSKGNHTDTWYLGLDGKPLTNAKWGCAHIHFDYNDLSQCIRTSYFDADENPATLIGSRYSYMEQTYKDGYCVEERYYDTDQNLVLREDLGYAVIKYTYNDLWQEEERTFYGTNGEPVTDNEGYAGYYYGYDDRGNQTTIRYMDVTGSYKRHDNTGGLCRRKDYDEFDNLISDNYYYIISDGDESIYQPID